MPNDAYEYMKMLLNGNKNAKIVIECELHANVRFLALMNASSRYWSSIHTNECVFSRNEQQKVYLFLTKDTRRGGTYTMICGTMVKLNLMENNPK